MAEAVLVWEVSQLSTLSIVAIIRELYIKNKYANRKAAVRILFDRLT